MTLNSSEEGAYALAKVKNVDVGLCEKNLIFDRRMVHMIGGVFGFKELSNDLWVAPNGYIFVGYWLDFDYNKKSTRIVTADLDKEVVIVRHNEHDVARISSDGVEKL